MNATERPQRRVFVAPRAGNSLMPKVLPPDGGEPVPALSEVQRWDLFRMEPASADDVNCPRGWWFACSDAHVYNGVWTVTAERMTP